MVMISEEEYRILEEKIINPQKSIYCPRCGNEIEYIKSGNSEAAICKTKNCISYSIRGL